MKAEIYKNIDLVQVDITAGKSEYKLPKNVDWESKQVDKLVLLLPDNPCLSPIDGVTTVLTSSQVSDMYFDIYRADESEIAQNLHYSNLLYSNNNPIRIDSVLSIKQARINFSTPPTTSGCILIYVFWGGTIDDDFQAPKKSETITIHLAGDEKMTFTQIINTYFHVRGERIRGVRVWDAENNPAYLTLRDHELSYIINNVHTALAKPEMQGASAWESPAHPLWLDSVDIDFDYSFVRNATSNNAEVKISFDY